MHAQPTSGAGQLHNSHATPAILATQLRQNPLRRRVDPQRLQKQFLGLSRFTTRIPTSAPANARETRPIAMLSPNDIISIVTLSWKLYHDCLLVAYDASDAFKQLVNELRSLQATLRLLRSNLEADKAFLDKASAERQATLQSGIEECWETLKSLERLTAGFYKLGRGGSLQLIKRIKWTYYQRYIEGYRARIMAHTCTLSLIMSAIGNATLLNIQHRLESALSPHRLQDLEPPPDPDTPLASDDGSPSSTPIPQRISRSPSLASSFAARNLDSGFPGTPDLNSARTVGGEHMLRNDPSDLGQVVADAKALLKCTPQKLPERRQFRIPLLVDPPYPEYVVDQGTAQRFETAASSQEAGSVSVSEWLQCAEWWLLKSRVMFSAYQRSVRGESPYSSLSGASTTPVRQERPEISLLLALDNIRKVSWIVYEVVLRDEAIVSSLTDHNTKLFLSLVHGIYHDFPNLLNAEAQITQPDDIKIPLHTTIWERPYVVDIKIMDGRSPKQKCGEHSRWIAVEDKDTGARDAGEHVLFRTFVNAAIGDHEFCVRSMGAPYLLVLWCKDWESEFKVTICNQRGIVHLSRDLTKECLPEFETSEVGLASMPILKLVFPGPMPATIEFLNEGDFEGFLRIPRRYFDAISHEFEENSDNERLLGPPIVLESMTQSTPIATRVRGPSYNFCEARIFETLEGGWQRTRRLVFTSSPNEEPQCKSYFLPLDYVYISHETESKKLILKYSDCNQSRTRLQPDNTHRWSREYDPSDPNIRFDLSFRSPTDAYEFKQKVLNYSQAPLWQSDVRERQIYAIFKVTGIGQEDYRCRALQTISTTSDGWTFASIFYVPKTIDFALEHYGGLTVHFDSKSTFVADYISNHTMEFSDMRPPLAAQFHHCEKRHIAQDILLREFSVAQQLFRSLTSGWHLKYAGNVIQVKYEPTTSQSWFSKKPRTPKGAANISVWQKDPGRKQLLARWGDSSTDHWLSVALRSTPTMNQPQRPGSEKAVIHSIDIARGTRINLSSMAAVEARNKVKENCAMEGLITIQFETCREKEKFAEAAGLVCP